MPQQPKKQPDYSKAPNSSLKLMGRYIPSHPEKKVHPFVKPFYKVEQRLEKVLHWLRNMALLEILGIVGNVGLIIAVVTYIGSEKQRRNAEVLNAWQTLTSAYEQSGSGGRIQALEFLNASPGANWRRKFPWVCAPHPLCVWPAESLAGINLAVESTEIKLSTEEETDSSKTEQRLSGVYLATIQLPNAFLQGANFEGAFLQGANLEGAFLWGANLEGAFLFTANLEGAFLGSANLEGAELGGANLVGAKLGGANLEGAFLSNANLEGASLSNANLEGAFLGSANLEGAKHLETEQVTNAMLCFTKLPPDIGIPPNRDCAKLGLDPETGERIGVPEDQ
jgi:uncharacterized protein YjbI with pentapeptide repeats